MSIPYACNIDGRASGIPIALWCTEYRQRSPEARFELSAAPIRGAFVACVRVSKNQASTAITPDDIRYGRTNEVGWVVHRELSELGEPDELPRASWKPAPAPVFWFLTGADPVVFEVDEQTAEPTLMYGLPNEGYRIYWSYDRVLFDSFVEQLQKDPYGTLDAWGVRLHVMEPFGEPAPIDDLDLLTEDERKAVSRLLLAGHRLGYHAGWHFKDQRTAAIFDATPDTLRALFRAEFFAWYAREAVKRSGSDVAVLLRAKGIAEAARNGTPEAEFEASLWCDSERSGQFLWCDDPATARRQHRVFEKYRIYAWRCAMGDITKDEFERSLPTSTRQIHGDDRRWYAAADRIGRETTQRLGRASAAVHPLFDPSIPRDDLMLGKVALRAILAYYDLYVLGRDLGADATDLLKQLGTAQSEWDQLPYSVQAKCKGELEAAPFHLFQQDLAACCRDERAIAHLYERYLDALAAAGQSWWEVLAKQGGKADFWKTLEPAGKLLGAALDSTGKSLSGMVEKRLAAHSLAFKEAQDLIDALYRQERLYSGQTVDPDVHFIERPNPTLPNYRALVDVRNGHVTVTYEHPDHVGRNRKFEFQLLRKTGAASSLAGAETGSYSLASQLSAKYSKDLVVPVDLASLKQRSEGLPKAFSVCAETINVAFATANVVRAIQADTGVTEVLQAGWELTKGIVGLIDSYQTAVNALKRPIPPETFLSPSPKGGLHIATRVVGGVDGFFTIYSGLKVLFSEDGDLAYELRHGRDARAFVHGIKGVLQVSLGAVGILGALPATASLVAGPVGLVMAIGGGLVVAGIDQALDATTVYEQHVNEFERALDAARRQELNEGRLRVVTTVTRASAALSANPLS